MTTLAPNTGCSSCQRRGHFCRATELDANNQPTCLDCEDGDKCAFDRRNGSTAKAAIPAAAPLPARTPPAKAVSASVKGDGRRKCITCDYMISAKAASRGIKTCHKCYARKAEARKSGGISLKKLPPEKAAAVEVEPATIALFDEPQADLIAIHVPLSAIDDFLLGLKPEEKARLVSQLVLLRRSA